MIVLFLYAICAIFIHSVFEEQIKFLKSQRYVLVREVKNLRTENEKIKKLTPNQRAGGGDADAGVSDTLLEAQNRSTV